MSTSLADRQEAFLAAILDDKADMPDGWGDTQALGMDVYRGNYRAALLGALADTFERTRAHVGEKVFAQASINHIIANPPAGWTIDEAGLGFDETCAQFFKQNPEVAELAWLEWTLLGLATAPDTEPLTAQDFGALAAGFGDEDWATVRLGLQPRSAARIVRYDLEALWKALGNANMPRPDARLAEPKAVIAWREGERPTFILTDADHATAFTAMSEGATYGELIALLLGEDSDPTPEAIQQAAMRAGEMLGTWLSEGMVVAINP